MCDECKGLFACSLHMCPKAAREMSIDWPRPINPCRPINTPPQSIPSRPRAQDSLAFKAVVSQ